MTKEEVQLISFQVIANAGEAFDAYVQAVKAASEFDFVKSEEMMKSAAQSMVSAHQAQTDLLNAEINGEEIPFSVILIHGQDHLMHAMSYEQNAKDMITLYKKMAESK